MRSTLRNSGIILSCSLLAVLCACGSGGGNPNNGLAVNNPPVATAPVTAAGTSLTEYQSYTFTTKVSDPDIGDTIQKVTWTFSDDPTHSYDVVTAPFNSPSHAFNAASDAIVELKFSFRC